VAFDVVGEGGAPMTKTTSWPPSSSTMRSRMAGRKPPNSAWSSGKPQRPLMGATRRGPGGVRPGPGRPRRPGCGPRPLRPRRPVRATHPAPGRCVQRLRSGRVSKPTLRSVMGSQGTSQSSAGMETKTGPRGSCMAM
jgi:hypothetical protein